MKNLIKEGITELHQIIGPSVRQLQPDNHSLKKLIDKDNYLRFGRCDKGINEHDFDDLDNVMLIRFLVERCSSK